MSSDSSRRPRTLGDYTVVRLIAKGGMGAVYEVEHRTTAVHYALKTLLKDGDERARARFRREAELLSRCDRHAAIVRVHSFGETDDGALYLVLDLVEGSSLEEMIAQDEKLPHADVARLGRALAHALAFIHERGIVHRDIKPSNILVDWSGPRLTDFGISTAVDVERLTRTGTLLGTLLYMSPEQASARGTGAASDVYSLGAVLFHALTGRPPIQAVSPVEVMVQLGSPTAHPDVRELAPECPAPARGDRRAGDRERSGGALPGRSGARARPRSLRGRRAARVSRSPQPRSRRCCARGGRSRRRLSRSVRDEASPGDEAGCARSASRRSSSVARGRESAGP
jgi:serine/threonine protein kinase